MSELSWATQPGPLIALTGLLGLLVGSFLNVVILRLPKRLEHDWQSQARELLGHAHADEAPPPDLVVTGSHCPSCKHPLSAYDNIPVLSWLALGGRCRYCKTKISWQYPLVELLTALASAAIAWKFGFGWPLAAGLVFTWMLIASAGIDARTQLLPDQLTLPLLWLGLLLSLVPVFVPADTAIIGAAIGYLSLWSVYWLFKLIGALVGGSVLALRGQDRSTPIPFGPFIAAAGWVWFLLGDHLATWYAAFFAAH